MSVIPLTVFLSLGLVLVFVVLFWREQRRRPFASAERDSLLPLADEQALVQPAPTDRVAAAAPTTAGAPADEHPHDHDDHHAGHGHGPGRCGCRTGERPPCPGCLHRHAAAPAH